MQLPESMTTDDFTRAVAVATVSALRHQQNNAQSPARARISGLSGDTEPEGSHGGHEGPSWSRTTSAAVLLGCTALYAVIAGELVIEHINYNF
jgi:Ca2+:H+ antiporter